MKDIFDKNRSYYDAQAETYFTQYKDEIKRKPYDRLFLDLLSSFLPAGGGVLDVGCRAACQQANYLAQFHPVTAIDLSPKNIECAQRAFPHLQLFCRNMLSTEFPSKSFDGICAMYSVIHLPKKDVAAALQEFKRVLKNDGVLAVAVHAGDFEGLIDQTSFEDGVGSQQVYLSTFKRGFLDELLEANGFSVLHSAFRKQIYDFEYSSSRIYIIARKF